MLLFIKTLFSFGNLKIFLIVAGMCGALWFYKDYKAAKADNVRIKENATWERKFDSLSYSQQTYTTEELQQYLDYQRADLKDFLSQNRISTRQIERIISQKLEYLDTLTRSQDLSPILEAIKDNRQARVAVTDSTDCLVVRGWVVFDGDSLSLDISERKFNNLSDVVTYWERNKWSFLGIKTRIFGRKKVTVIIKDACGKTITKVIDRQRR